MKLLIFLVFASLSFYFCNARPKKRYFVDMSYVFDNTTLKYPLFSKYEVVKLVKGPNKNLATKWLQYEDFRTSTHTGTHMDAPAHVYEGEFTVDEIPPQRFFAKAAVIDIVAKAALYPDAMATISDLEYWENTTKKSLNGHIVLLNSGWGHKWNDRDAFLGSSSNDTTKLHFPGFSPKACKWLVDNRRIKGIGSDTASIDVGKSTSSPCHAYILGSRLYILENVANVYKIPISGAKLHVFPMKIGKGSAAPTRIVASVPTKNRHLN